MKNLKIRLFDKDLKNYWHFDLGDISQISDYLHVMEEHNVCDPELYIGLKDKNDIHIYENDFYKVLGCIFLVVSKDCRFVGKVISSPDINFVDKNLPPLYSPINEVISGLEVLGNDNQNPELLKSK